MQCSVQYASDFSVLWMKKGRGYDSTSLPLSTGATLIVQDSRFALRYDQSSSTYVLQVNIISFNKKIEKKII